MLLLEKTKEYQSSLAEYCRTGVYTPIPGVNNKHVGHYRRLIYNIIYDSLESAYPLTKEALTDDEWDSAIHNFFSNWPCQSPQIWYMPKELYEYIRSEEKELEKKYPFLSSLLWFEWLEIEVYMMEDIKVEYTTKGDPDKDKLILNPEIKLEHFTYPVHIKNANKITLNDRGDYFVSLHRMPESGSVRFTDLSPAFAKLLEILSETPVSLIHLIRKLSEDLNIEANDKVIKMIRNFVTDSIEKKLIIGFKR